MVELAEEVERYHRVHVDDYTGHQHCHCKLGARWGGGSGWVGREKKEGEERREGEERERKERERKGGLGLVEGMITRLWCQK